MSTGKTYSTKYLLDSNNNRGAEGQVLSTTSTGIDWVDANTVPGTGLWIQSGNNIYNSNSGNVGIGTTSPQAKLEIGSTSGAASGQYNSPSALLISTSGGSAGAGGTLLFGADGSSASDIQWSISNSNSGSNTTGSIGNLNFNTKQTLAGTVLSPAMTILSSGNVGIGTESPDTKLMVSGEILSENTNGGYFISTRVPSSSSRPTLNFYGTALDINHVTGYAGGGASTKMTILSGGNVGIGTTSPIDKLNVNGGTGDATTQQPKITVTRTSSTGNVLAGKMILTTKPSDPTNHGNLVFQVKTTASAGESSAYYTNAITIDGKNANVGIGTSSPTQ